MEIHCIYGVEYDSNIYIVKGAEPALIDCGTGLHSEYVEERIKEIINPSEIKKIILTHEHYDHCGGVRKIYELTGKKARILSHINASKKIETGDSDFAKMLGGTMPKMPVDVKLRDGDVLKIGDETFNVLHTPGHTPGCICLYSEKSRSLFSGDTVFAYGSFGRYDFPGGDPKQLRQSIEKLANLDILNIYPGHDTIVEGDGDKHMKATLDNSKYLVDL